MIMNNTCKIEEEYNNIERLGEKREKTREKELSNLKIEN